MAKVERWEPGSFCWVELRTTDPAGARAFYRELFGWQAVDEPTPGGTFTRLRLDGDDVGALYQQPAARREAGARPSWLAYVAVDDVDAAARRVAELGGEVTAGPFDVGSAGRSAHLRDPEGAELALWQPLGHVGARRAAEAGTLCWSELATRDPAAAGAFYGSLFDWGRKEQDMEGTTYTEWQNGDRSVGGMIPMDAEWGDAPPHWMLYFEVDDVDATAERAGELGGELHVGPLPIPGVGRFAMLSDPQGAMFSVIRLDEAAGSA